MCVGGGGGWSSRWHFLPFSTQYPTKTCLSIALRRRIIHHFLCFHFFYLFLWYFPTTFNHDTFQLYFSLVISHCIFIHMVLSYGTFIWYFPILLSYDPFLWDFFRHFRMTLSHGTFL